VERASGSRGYGRQPKPGADIAGLRVPGHDADLDHEGWSSGSSTARLAVCWRLRVNGSD